MFQFLLIWHFHCVQTESWYFGVTPCNITQCYFHLYFWKSLYSLLISLILSHFSATVHFHTDKSTYFKNSADLKESLVNTCTLFRNQIKSMSLKHYSITIQLLIKFQAQNPDLETLNKPCPPISSKFLHFSTWYQVTSDLFLKLRRPTGHRSYSKYSFIHSFIFIHELYSFWLMDIFHFRKLVVAPYLSDIIAIATLTYNS